MTLDRTWTHPRYAVIPTTGRGCFYEALAAIQPQVDRTFVIWAPPEAVEPPPMVSFDGSVVTFDVDSATKRNLSRWWNIGIDEAKYTARTSGADRWEVAVLNDDAIVPEDWFERVASRIRQMKVAAGSMGAVPMPILHTHPAPTELYKRMQGFAFILAGELGIRADESLEWWCGDNDIDMQARLKGGTIIIPDTGVKHLFPDQSTVGELAERTGVDMQRFIDKWGWRPWSL